MQRARSLCTGSGAFPITFYKEEWGTVLGMAEDIKSFIAEHESELTTKR